MVLNAFQAFRVGWIWTIYKANFMVIIQYYIYFLGQVGSGGWERGGEGKLSRQIPF